MRGRFFYDADGELLIVPQQGRLLLATELGRLEVAPLEIAVIPRGLRFRVELLGCRRARLPVRELRRAAAAARPGPDRLQRPCQRARFPDAAGLVRGAMTGISSWWRSSQVTCGRRASTHSPLDVVAWHGNNVPYKYDLRRFNTMGSVSFDHPDPSIFLVLQSVSDTPGVDTLDFVIFPPRWLVMDDTFRPPWFHRNVASEFMGLIEGVYDAKAEGFGPGGASLHNCMSGHGPDADTLRAGERGRYQQAGAHQPTPWPSCSRRAACIHPTRYALETPLLQRDYGKVLAGPGEALQATGPGRRAGCGAQAAAPMSGLNATHDPRSQLGEFRQRRGRGLPAAEPAVRGVQAAPRHAGFPRRGGHRRPKYSTLRRLPSLRPSRDLRRRPCTRQLSRPSTRSWRSGGRRAVALRAALSAALRSDAAHSARLRPLLLPQSQVEYRVAAQDRQLHRFLHLHSPRHRGRAAVPPRQPAAAELQVGADRLSRPRLLGVRLRSGIPRDRAASCWPPAPRCQSSHRRGAWTTSWRWASSSAAATRSAAPYRSRRPRTTSSACVCSMTGRRATCRRGSTSRSGRSLPRALPPPSRRGW